MGQVELTDTRVKRKAVHPFSCGENKHGARSVDDVAGGHLVPALLQEIFLRTLFFLGRFPVF